MQGSEQPLRGITVVLQVVHGRSALGKAGWALRPSDEGGDPKDAQAPPTREDALDVDNLVPKIHEVAKLDPHNTRGDAATVVWGHGQCNGLLRTSGHAHTGEES